MIPHRMPGNEISDSGLKDRVTACRKRLRVNRATHKPHTPNEADELFSETAPAQSGELEESGTLLLTGEQEVGIT